MLLYFEYFSINFHTRYIIWNSSFIIKFLVQIVPRIILIVAPMLTTPELGRHNKVIVSLLCCSHYIQDAGNRDGSRKAVVHSWLRVDTSYNNRIIPEYTIIIWPNRVPISTPYPSILYAHSWPKCAMLRSNDSEKQGHRYREVDFLVPFFHGLISFRSLSFSRTSAGRGCSLKR